MEKLRFEFIMKAATDKKSNALLVTSIKTQDGETFDLPEELQNSSPSVILTTYNIFQIIQRTYESREAAASSHKEGGIKIEILESAFARDSVKYLGHIIQNNSVKPLNDNLIAIKKFPMPTTKKNVRQFLGKKMFIIGMYKHSYKVRPATQFIAERPRVKMDQRMPEIFRHHRRVWWITLDKEVPTPLNRPFHTICLHTNVQIPEFTQFIQLVDMVAEPE
ncbi:uncharacterized protein LOC122519067 [Polistes fuscatus]|uniref:uncharacterized protein LOC122519067 n=1 Tax=Polistes fuscatus TaxID=30207 RepID=UPI001CA8BB47|nr:uncharacterized protein LOC122519067 [Polistes fuscatus]